MKLTLSCAPAQHPCHFLLGISNPPTHLNHLSISCTPPARSPDFCPSGVLTLTQTTQTSFPSLAAPSGVVGPCCYYRYLIFLPSESSAYPRIPHSLSLFLFDRGCRIIPRLTAHKSQSMVQRITLHTATCANCIRHSFEARSTENLL